MPQLAPIGAQQGTDLIKQQQHAKRVKAAQNLYWAMVRAQGGGSAFPIIPRKK